MSGGVALNLLLKLLTCTSVLLVDVRWSCSLELTAETTNAYFSYLSVEGLCSSELTPKTIHIYFSNLG